MREVMQQATWLDGRKKKLYLTACRTENVRKHLDAWAVREGKRTKWVLVATWTIGEVSYFVWNDQKKK